MSVPDVSVKRLVTEPSECPVEDSLRVVLDFELSAPVENATWELKVSVLVFVSVIY